MVRRVRCYRTLLVVLSVYMSRCVCVCLGLFPYRVVAMVPSATRRGVTLLFMSLIGCIVAVQQRRHNYVAIVAMITLTALAFEPWSRGVLLSLSGSKRPTRC